MDKKRSFYDSREREREGKKGGYCGGYCGDAPCDYSQLCTRTVPELQHAQNTPVPSLRPATLRKPSVELPFTIQKCTTTMKQLRARVNYEPLKWYTAEADD